MIDIRLPDRRVSVDLNAKSVRKVLATIGEHGPDGVAVIVQGKLMAGDVLAEAGIVANPKAPKEQPEASPAASAAPAIRMTRTASAGAGPQTPEMPPQRGPQDGAQPAEWVKAALDASLSARPPGAPGATWSDAATASRLQRDVEFRSRNDERRAQQQQQSAAWPLRGDAP